MTDEQKKAWSRLEEALRRDEGQHRRFIMPIENAQTLGWPTSTMLDGGDHLLNGWVGKIIERNGANYLQMEHTHG